MISNKPLYLLLKIDIYNNFIIKIKILKLSDKSYNQLASSSDNLLYF